MKNFKKIFTLIMLMLFIVSVSSCKKCNKNKNDDCVTHVDVNNDKKCDVCGAEIKDQACTAHVDTNNDQKCDVCGAHVEAPVTNVKVSIQASANKINKGEEVTLTVTVTEVEDQTYELSVSDETLLKVEGNKVICINTKAVDTAVTVTAKSVADPKATASTSIIVVAPIIEGQVGELTSEMLKEIGNASITSTGTLTDYYVDFNQAANNSTIKYDMKVMMSEGYWYGEYNIQNNLRSQVVDVYKKGDVDGIKDSYGRAGHALTRLYINKNNEVAESVVKDYNSFASLWEEQHLWNHLSNLNIDKFSYDVESELYVYNIDINNADDLYLMTYLSYCLTPLVSDTLMTVALKVENGKITQFLGQTEVLFYGADIQEDADAMSYSSVVLEFSEIGTTVVPLPQVYEAPLHADVLKAALDKMANAKNYTYRVEDVTTYAPVTDGDDYIVESTNSSAVKAKPLTNKREKVQNSNSSVGTVGSLGQVTENAILIAETGKYSYGMDDKLYYTNYSGYKQNSDNSYDYFEYDSKSQTLVGKKRFEGTLTNVLPTFDFSPNIFKYNGSTINTMGKEVYTFVLRSTDVTRDVALEISSYKYADDASKTATETLTLVVDEDGNLISTVYPYNLVEGTYYGYCNTTFSKVGTTELDADTFDGYVQREILTSWNQYTTKYYSENYSTLTTHDENTQVVIDAIYGASAKDLPAPTLFLDVFGDNLSGPFFDWKEKATDADGNPIYTSWIEITTTSSEFDENAKITNYEEIIEELTTLLEAEGFVISKANTDTSGGPLGKSDRFICFIKGDIQIVIENNHTKYFWIKFYKTGDWSLN